MLNFNCHVVELLREWLLDHGLAVMDLSLPSDKSDVAATALL